MKLRSLTKPCDTCDSHNICHWFCRLMNWVKPNGGLIHHSPLIVTWGVILMVSCLWERELYLPHPRDRGSIPRAQQKQSLWESMMHHLKYYGHFISWRLRVIQCCSPQKYNKTIWAPNCLERMGKPLIGWISFNRSVCIPISIRNKGLWQERNWR